ncbi:unnamed protein product [Rotaria magnacalcarata]|uniref:Uncharacterized protein n=1 Tax=Rotaria magnacalcarata TaxID=392030 RepID=A0A816Q6M4_9BILA|nr:unnamed protein product [Rotaria magnacalcarata]CAF4079331.1 unnamed protein product [Rotaria magnacalcarata]
MFLLRELLFAISALNICSMLPINEAFHIPAAENNYHSNNVTEVTSKFVDGCSHANESIEYTDHPEKDVYGEQLQAIVCTVGDSQKRTIIYTISGTHSVEGYAGSMAQISMLRGNSSMSPPDVRRAHLHLINPYGASYILKENEQNANQLKNNTMYYTLHYDNPILQRLIDQIELPTLGNKSARQNAYAVIGQLFAEYDREVVNMALKTGQGRRPQGIAYFGPPKSLSSQIEDYVVAKYFPYETDIILIGLHTAIGPYGTWSFMPIDKELETAFRRWAPNDLMASYGIVIPSGGQLPYSNIKPKTNAKRVIRGIWEAGTYNVIMKTNAMFMPCLCCHFYTNASDPFRQDIISKINEYFYPQADEWKRLTYNAINNVFSKVLSGFAAEISSGTKIIVADCCIIL